MPDMEWGDYRTDSFLPDFVALSTSGSHRVCGRDYECRDLNSELKWHAKEDGAESLGKPSSACNVDALAAFAHVSACKTESLGSVNHNCFDRTPLLAGDAHADGWRPALALGHGKAQDRMPLHIPNAGWKCVDPAMVTPSDRPQKVEVFGGGKSRLTAIRMELAPANAPRDMRGKAPVAPPAAPPAAPLAALEQPARPVPIQASDPTAVKPAMHRCDWFFESTGQACGANADCPDTRPRFDAWFESASAVVPAGAKQSTAEFLEAAANHATSTDLTFPADVGSTPKKRVHIRHELADLYNTSPEFSNSVDAMMRKEFAAPGVCSAGRCAKVETRPVSHLHAQGAYTTFLMGDGGAVGVQRGNVLESVPAHACADVDCSDAYDVNGSAIPPDVGANHKAFKVTIEGNAYLVPNAVYAADKDSCAAKLCARNADACPAPHCYISGSACLPNAERIAKVQLR